jgi:multiple sugar transport system ATP-binding protein
MAQVTFDRVGKIFNDTVALRELNLAVRSGEFMSLLGPSGCGKTTSLRMLAGLDHPTSGTIAIGDRVVNELPPAKRDIAMVFQSYALYPHMSVAQNIEYPLRKRRVPRGERDARVRRAAALLQLEGLMDRKPRQLSGGQQQRVALGRALVRDPAVFLLDEPLSNLDAKLRAHMRAELIQLHQRIGRTMIYVTHDQLEAMTMSDRIAILSNGVLQQCGTPDEVYNRPANLFVASFIGTPSMNVVNGTLDRSAGGVSIAGGGLSVALPAHAIHPDGARGGEVSVGIRPEDVLLASDGEGAVVKVVEPAGHENIVLFDLSGTEIVGRFGPDVRLRPREPVALRFRSSRLHVFDRETGRRLNTDIEVLDGRLGSSRHA